MENFSLLSEPRHGGGDACGLFGSLAADDPLIGLGIFSDALVVLVVLVVSVGAVALTQFKTYTLRRVSGVGFGVTVSGSARNSMANVSTP